MPKASFEELATPIIEAALDKHADDVVNQVTRMILAGKTINEIRSGYGLECLEDGDWVYNNLVAEFLKRLNPNESNLLQRKK